MLALPPLPVPLILPLPAPAAAPGPAALTESWTWVHHRTGVHCSAADNTCRMSADSAAIRAEFCLPRAGGCRCRRLQKWSSRKPQGPGTPRLRPMACRHVGRTHALRTSRIRSARRGILHTVHVERTSPWRRISMQLVTQQTPTQTYRHTDVPLDSGKRGSAGCEANLGRRPPDVPQPCQPRDIS